MMVAFVGLVVVVVMVVAFVILIVVTVAVSGLTRTTSNMEGRY